MTCRRVVLAIAAAGIAAFAGPAAAGMGTAPPGTYISFEGGYLYQDAPDVTGHGIVTTAGGPIQDTFVSPNDGYFAGGLIGFNTGAPFLAGFTRFEVFLLFGSADDSLSDSVPPLADVALKNADGTILVTGGGLGGTTSVELETWEGGFSFKDDDRINGTTTVTWVVSTFLRNSQEDTTSSVTSTVCCTATRTGDVETWYYGILFAAEPETWLTSNLALVARLGAGVYGYDADGDFRSSSNGIPDVFASSVSDGDSGAGFRGLLGIGLKFKLTTAATLEAFGEADYFSDVGTAHLADNQPTSGDTSYVDTDDLWELRTGVRITIGLGGSN
jgi:hypothetical protein